MVGARHMRWVACILVGGLWLAGMSGCAKQEAASPETQVSAPPPASAPRDTAPAPGRPAADRSPASVEDLSPGVMTGSTRDGASPSPIREDPTPSPVSASPSPPSEPNYAWLPPKEPMIAGSSGVFSIAVSYGSTSKQLQDFLLKQRIASLQPAKNPQGNQGTLQSADGGAIFYIRAQLSCMGLTCPPDSGSIQTLAGGHTAYWEWPIEPAADQSGDAVVTVHFAGGQKADGSDFKPIQEIPAIEVPITIHWVDWLKLVRETLEALAAIAGVILGFWRWLLPILQRKGRVDTPTTGV